MRKPWDECYFDILDIIKQQSKDRSTKIGAVIVRGSKEIISMGYNCFPRGINDNCPERQERPMKYFYFEHAERNAIYNAVRNGICLADAIMYLEFIPCADCARAIIQSGIKQIVVKTSELLNERWIESCGHGLTMLKEAGVLVTCPK